MIIAEQKRKENIAEYLIYMYQVEDMIRANDFDLQQIEQTVINQFDVDYGVKREMREWYKGLIDMMVSEGIRKNGHMKFLNDIADDLNQVHVKMLSDGLHTAYKESFENARPHLEALRMRSGHSSDNDVRIALNGLYGLLILKLSQQEISNETTEAFAAISAWVAALVAEHSN